LNTLIKALGELALATRLKQLSELVLQDYREVYENQQLNFEHKWFLVFFQLATTQTAMPITEIAKAIGISHPAVNKIVGEMLQAGLLEEVVSGKDKRKRQVALSESGKNLYPKLQPLWNMIELAMTELLETCAVDLVAVVDSLEKQLEKTTMAERITEKIRKYQQENIDIIDFESQYRNDFKTLNEEWLNKYFEVEETDKKVLENPENEILAKGGFILFAKFANVIVGTCAVLKIDETTYELAKMGVTEKAQGKQVGRKLAIAALQRIRTIGGKTVILESSLILVKAMSLYRQLGFEVIENSKKSKYKRPSVIMKLNL
jgi:DNA-binding MarR family transcriptional regulator